MPTAFMSMLPRPCATGLLRPKRLFEVDGTTGGDPSSHCGLEARGGHGLPSATAPSIMPESARRELQGGPCEAWWRGRPQARCVGSPPPPPSAVPLPRFTGEDRIPTDPSSGAPSFLAVAIEARLLELLPEPAQQPHDFV